MKLRLALLLPLVLTATAGLAQTNPLLFVVNKAEDTLSVIDTHSLRETHRITVGGNPHEMAVTPDGRKAYVVNAGGNSISVIDLETYAETKRITHPDFSFPHGVAFTSDSRRALVTSERSGKIFLIDATNDEVLRAIDTDQGGTHMAAVDTAGEWAYFSNRESNTISFMDLENYEIVANVAVGEGAEGFALSPDSREIWVSERNAGTVSVVDVPGQRVVARVDIGPRPNRVSFTPDGRHVVIPLTAGDVAVFDRATRERVGELRVGEGPGGIVASPDGKRMFVASGSTGSIDIIDTDNWVVTDRIPVGQGPDGLAIR